MHSWRGGVGSNIWLYEPGIILSLHLARSALKIPISRSRTLVQGSFCNRNYRRKRSRQFKPNPRFEPFWTFKISTTTAVDTVQYPLPFCVLFPPASTTHFYDSSFPISVSQNGIPNGIPSHTAIISVHEILMYPETKLAKLSFIAHSAFTNLEVSLALVFHLAPRGFPSNTCLSPHCKYQLT